MGRATLVALAAACALAGSAAAGAGLDSLVDAGRAHEANLTPLYDELEALRRSYAWERDAARAGARRDALRARLAPELQGLSESAAAVEEQVARFASDHGIETLSLMASGKGEASPAVKSALRAQTFLQQARTTVRSGTDLLHAEEREWKAFSALAAERRLRRRLLAGLGAFALLLAAFGARLALVLRRRRNERIPEIVDR